MLHQKEYRYYVWTHAPTISYVAKREVAMTLHFHLQYALPITQHCKQRTAQAASQQSIISRVYNGEDTLDHIAYGKYSHRGTVSQYNIA